MIKGKLNPFFRYPGSKHTIAQLYPKPKYDIIIEVGCGSAGYSCLYHENKVILNDINTGVTNLWSWLTKATADDIYNILNNPLNSYWQTWSGYPYFKPRFTWIPGRLTGERRNDIISQLPYIQHWAVTNYDCFDIPNIKATWFIDMPYQHVRAYKGCRVNYRRLEEFVLSRKGQVIVCEQRGANWMSEFRDLCTTINSSREVYWTNDAG